MSQRYGRAVEAVMVWKSVRFQLLGIAAIVAYFGGPLLVADFLKPSLGPFQALWISVLPVLLMLFGMAETTNIRPPLVVVQAGLVGLALTLVMDIYAIWGLAHGLGAPNQPMHILGILAVVPWCIAYWRKSRRWLLSRRGSSDAGGGPSSPKPIEPR